MFGVRIARHFFKFCCEHLLFDVRWTISLNQELYEFQLNYFSYSQYSIISEADRVITFGGHCHYQAPFELDEVTEYKNDEWTLLGTDSQR